MNKNIIILQEMYKTVTMGIKGIDEVKNKITDKVLLKTVIDASKKYEAYKLAIVDKLKEYEEKPEEINKIIQVSNEIYTDMLLINTDDAKITKMLMEGTNKGIIKLQEIKNNEKIDDEKVKNIVLELLSLFQDQINAWKNYL
jgi:hypothetical protein